MNKVAVIVLGYRMPEMTDRLVARLKEVTRYPHDLFVIDNGSPVSERAKSTTHWCDPNRRLTGGFNFGIECARAMEQDVVVSEEMREAVRAQFQMTPEGRIGGEPYDAFWFVCNDIRLNRQMDVLAACMAQVRRAREEGKPIGVIHPAVERDGTGFNWPHMYAQQNRTGIHDAFFVDIIAPIYTRDAMEAIGWEFLKDLVYGWGIDLASCYESWRHDLRVVVSDEVEVWHKMGTTYNAGKDLEFKDWEAYKAAAGGAQWPVLEARYGVGYDKKFAAAPAAYYERRRAMGRHG